MLALEPLFAGLELPPAAGEDSVLVSARAIPGHEQFRIAKDSSGHALLLASITSEDVGAQAPLMLEHLRVAPARPCRVRRPDGDMEAGIFTVVTCASHDPALRSYFLLVAGLIVESSTASASAVELSGKVLAFVELFRAMQQPARKPAQGLWAELAVILWSRCPATLLRAWHAEPEERFDFCLGRERVEVKSTVGPHRRHHFSQAQLDVPPGTNALVASMFVERAGGGVSIRELMKRIGRLVASQPDLLLRMESVVAATLGNTLSSSSEQAFDLERAGESLRYFNARELPRIPDPIPPALSDLRFVADLTGVPIMEVETTSAADPYELISCLPAPH